MESQSPKIPNEEWDFTKVPNHELQTCVIYEYARECVSFIGFQLKHRLESKDLAEKEQAHVETARKVVILREILSEIEAQGFDQESFLGKYYDTDCGYAQLYDFLRDNVTPFSLAWTALSEDVRTSLCEMTKNRMAFFPPLKPAYVEHLEQLWTENSKDLLAMREHYKGIQLDDGDYAELFAETKPLLAKPGHSSETHGETVAAFAIDFKRHTNITIIDAFSVWLKENRPSDCPEPTLVGKKRIDLKFDLKCLGAMRLLHWLTFEEIDFNCPEVWQSEQFEGKKWRDANKWYAARRQAFKTYHEVFPFLDKGEVPLHAQTAGERKKKGFPSVSFKWSDI